MGKHTLRAIAVTVFIFAFVLPLSSAILIPTEYPQAVLTKSNLTTFQATPNQVEEVQESNTKEVKSVETEEIKVEPKEEAQQLNSPLQPEIEPCVVPESLKKQLSDMKILRENNRNISINQYKMYLCVEGEIALYQTDGDCGENERRDNAQHNLNKLKYDRLIYNNPESSINKDITNLQNQVDNYCS